MTKYSEVQAGDVYMPDIFNWSFQEAISGLDIWNLGWWVGKGKFPKLKNHFGPLFNVQFVKIYHKKNG